MKPYLFLSSVFLMMACVACNNDSTSSQNGQVEYPQANQPSNMSLTSEANSDTIKNPVGTTTTTLQTAPVKSTAGLNPAHGQPGHRCDISVGAPLDSKPTQGANMIQPATNNPPPLPVNLSPLAPTQKVAPGMNPAHGQPGHRCDIAVGAPLNSKPAASPLPPPTPALPIIPAKKDSTSS